MAPKEVDTTIYAHATGTALQTAKQHEAEKPLKLYAGWFCPFVQRTWITLEEKKIAYQYIEINPYRRDPEFLKLNPRGLIPTLGVSVPQAQQTNGNSKQKTMKPLEDDVENSWEVDEAVDESI